MFKYLVYFLTNSNDKVLWSQSIYLLKNTTIKINLFLKALIKQYIFCFHNEISMYFLNIQ